MPFIALQPHVSFGRVGDRPVFLDLARDRYLALDEPRDASFRRLGDGSLPLTTAEVEALLATGLFRSSGAPASLDAAAAPAPTGSLLDDPLPRPRLLAAARAQLLLIEMRRRLKSTALHTIIDRLKAERADARNTHDPGRCAASADDFLAARMMLPRARSCLPDSLALIEWLRPQSLFPTLVFGVKLHPFKAHCWVQAGGLLLADSVDAVAEFTPVLVIE